MNVRDVLTEGLDIQDSIIKVMGVGGGGCNAINYLYNQGIQDVSLLVCNTDKMSLDGSSVPSKLQLGTGLGVGGKPGLAKQYAEEDRERIRESLNDGTKMLFITAGMGGGTGTGASPIVAEVAKEMGILTVGIVTIPFAFEGVKKIEKAMKGVAELAAQVDAILVINNEKLRQIYPDLNLLNAFKKSDDVVANSARSIAEIITKPGYINTDFTDVYNTLKDGGVAIMSVGTATGENRVANAIHEALHSPLINTEVHGATRLLFQIYCSTEHAMVMSEIDQIHDFVREVGDDVEVQWGAAIDEELGESVRVTIIATGYEVSNIPNIDNNPSDSIKDYYDDPATAKKKEEITNEDEVSEPLDDEKPVEVKLEVPGVGASAVEPVVEEAEEEDIVIKLDEEDYQDERPGTLFSGWMRGRNR
ncbi:MAG: cell division protein FtsZ [Paludibacteraceae bacterium]|nr:cell division protein FtsZ [Paludibacteraceae bacterium]